MTQVLIIGCGLGGAAAGLACARAGLAVHLFERAPDRQTAGAGITVSPSVRRALDWLGVGAAFDAAVETPERPTLLDWRTGAPLVPDLVAGAAHLDEVRRIHRADLHRVLMEALVSSRGAQVHFGAHVTGLWQDDEGAGVTFEDTTQARGDLLICADGVRSMGRAFVDGPDEPRFTGYVAWRFMIPSELAAPFLHGRGAVITTGPGGNLTAYSVDRGRQLNCVVMMRSDGWSDEGWTTRAEPGELLALLEGWNPDARALVQIASDFGVYKWALYDRPVAKTWTDRRVALLGDAAHPVLPFLGMGAGLAIEDAVVLGRCLASDPGPGGLRRYQAARIDRANLIQDASRYQGEALDRIADQPSRESPPMFDHALFSYDPATAPISWRGKRERRA